MTDAGVPGGALEGWTPGPDPASDRRRLRAVVADALILIGPGAGDGPPPAVVDSVTDALLDLYQLTGEQSTVDEWLATTLDLGSPEQAAAGAGPALARLLADGARRIPDSPYDVPEMTTDEDNQDRKDQQEAAARFAEIPDDLVTEGGPP